MTPQKYSIYAQLKAFSLKNWRGSSQSGKRLPLRRRCIASYWAVHVVLAKYERTDHIIGLLSAISDGVSAAFVPGLEVLPEWRVQGIGSQLVQHMLDRLKGLYAIDLMCDQELQSFYARFGMTPYKGMLVRDYARQACD